MENAEKAIEYPLQLSGKEKEKEMKCQKILFLLLVALFIRVNDAYRILGLFPFNGKSHFRMFHALCKGFAEKGHKIDMISHFPTKVPISNYADIIDFNGTREDVMNSFSVQHARTNSDNVLHCNKIWWRFL